MHEGNLSVISVNARRYKLVKARVKACKLYKPE